MVRFNGVKLALAAGVAMTLASVAQADAGFVALEGSDSTALHQDPQYTPQLFSYLQGSSTKDVLVLGNVGLSYTGGVTATYANSLTGVTLSDYSAIYIESPGGCCQADNTALNGFGAAVSAFISAGGNLSIENYVGGDYDGVVVGGAGAPIGSIAGYGTSGGGSSCTDTESVTAFGISKGFTQPPVDGCWEHQAYDMSYWGGLGYQNLIASSPFAYPFANGSAFIALGGTLGTPSAPEPSSWALMMIGFGAIGYSARRRAAANRAVA